MKKRIILSADISNLDHLYQFIQDTLAKYCVKSTQINVMEMVCEEIFTNIVNYAYQNEEKNQNDVEVDIEKFDDEIVITFKDKGTPFDPLSVEEPNVNITLEERDYGGLGLIMVKKSVDRVEYTYKDGENVFKLYKTIKSRVSETP